MRTKKPKTLPKIYLGGACGTIHVQQVRCGKSNCKCARGEKHLGYYYFVRISGVLTKTYIRKVDLAEFKKIVEEARSYHEEERRKDREVNNLIKRMNQLMRERDKQIKILKENFTQERNSK